MKERLFGAIMILAGAALTNWLSRLIEGIGYRQEGPGHLLIAAVTFLAFVAGLALLVIGPALSKPTDSPPH